MRCLSSALLEAQKQSQVQPAVRLTVRDFQALDVRLDWSSLYSGSEPEGPNCAVQAADGSLVRARLEEKLRRIRQMYQEVEITEEEYRRELAETKERLANPTPPQEMRADELLRAGEYLETVGPVWEAATPQERKEIYQLVLEVAYVDVLAKRLVEVVPKGAFASLFGESGVCGSHD